MGIGRTDQLLANGADLVHVRLIGGPYLALSD